VDCPNLAKVLDSYARQKTEPMTSPRPRTTEMPIPPWPNRLPRLLAAVASVCILLTPLAAARAEDKSRLTLLEENDSLYVNSDKHYTQGLLASYLGPDVRPGSFWNDPFALLGDLAPIFQTSDEHSRRYALEFGQNLYTPKDTQLRPPDPRDRPYAGWIYVGANLLQETNRRSLESFELQLGAVGPVALGKEVQNDFHQLIGKDTAKGWGTELQNEPGIVLAYDRLWHVPLIGDGKSGLDFVPQIGATIGNIYTYGSVGGLLRFGKNLQADYGPARIRPALSGTSYFNGDDLDGELGYYVFAGTQGRVVGQNIFLDGNTFRTSRNVPSKTLVADLQAGFSVFSTTAWRVDFSIVRRTEEFAGQATPDVIGTAAFSFSW
jgi:lipid A 3-O-deacylase